VSKFHKEPSIIRDSVTAAVKLCAKSRDQIAEEMSSLLDMRVTVRMVNSYTSEAAEKHRWPAEFDLAFCEATGDYSLLRDRVERAGFRMIGPEEARLIEVGRAYLEKARAEATLAQAWRVEITR
jgi:hypothetical protein